MLSDDLLDKFKVIAEFTGVKVEQAYKESAMYEQDGLLFDFEKCKHTFGKYPGNSRYHSTVSLKWNTSWNWLMPVWGKYMKLVHEKEVSIDVQWYKAATFTFKSGQKDILFDLLSEELKRLKEEGVWGLIASPVNTDIIPNEIIES